MTKSEKKMLRKIRRWLNRLDYKRYDFWFIYDYGSDTGNVITWEGGFELPSNNQFRNKYSIAPGKHAIKNW